MTGPVVETPGDVFVVSPGCRDIDGGTLDRIRMCRVDPRSMSKVYCGPSRGIIFYEGVVAVDLCPPGMLCKLDCPCLNPYLFVTLREWFIIGQE